MTQEEKQILLKDLCARLPYHPRINVCNDSWEGCQIGEFDTNLYSHHIDAFVCDRIEVKPYLRPMSSIMEEEKEDILQALNIHGDIDTEGNLLLGVECNILTLKVCKKYLGELNKRMFDVCHLIEKGLALEAPEDMYKTE